MTCIEAWRKLYPNSVWTERDVIKHECPNSYGIMSDSSVCGDCEECWNRTVPDSVIENLLKETLDKSQNLIKKWSIAKVSKGFVIDGYIYNDQRHRFDDGTPIRTSLVKYIDFEAKIAKTLNSTYNLE